MSMEPCVYCIYLTYCEIIVNMMKLSDIVNMCENLQEAVYFKELHNEQEYYILTDIIQNGGSCSVNYC